MGIPPQGIGGGEIIIIGGAGKEAERFILVAASDADESIKSVADYVCDGVNDEEEINQAIQQAVDEGIYTVVLSEGTFNVEPTNTFEFIGETFYCCIPITSSNVRLRGCGDKTVISLKPEVAEVDTGVIAIIGNETHISNISIENLYIKSNYQTTSDYFLLLLIYTDNSSVTNIILDSSETSTRSNFNILFCEKISVTNIVSYNTTTAIIYSSNVKVVDNMYLNTSITPTLNVLNSSKVTIKRNTIYSEDCNINLVTSNSISITGNLLNNVTQISQCSGIIFSNNQVIDSGRVIDLSSSSRCIFSNNNFYSTKGTTVIINLWNNDDYCIITNNTIYATNFTGQNPIAYTGSNHVIANNIIIVESGGG